MKRWDRVTDELLNIYRARGVADTTKKVVKMKTEKFFNLTSR